MKPEIAHVIAAILATPGAQRVRIGTVTHAHLHALRVRGYTPERAVDETYAEMRERFPLYEFHTIEAEPGGFGLWGWSVPAAMPAAGVA